MHAKFNQYTAVHVPPPGDFGKPTQKKKTVDWKPVYRAGVAENLTNRQISERIQQELGIFVPVRRIFQERSKAQ